MTTTPFADLIEDTEPNRVSYDITVIWPDGQRTNYYAMRLPLEQAAERLEVLAEELRQGLQSTQGRTYARGGR